jgi:signal transduction histidine kinase
MFDILGVEYEHEPPLDEALDVYHEDDRSVVEGAIEAALDTGESFDVEVRYRRAGETRWLRIQGVPVTDDGAVVTLRGAVQDVTERKRHVRKLAEQNRRLEEFASVVSHDLRNPLSVARGRLELAREAPAGDHFDAIARAHERMGVLLEDLLTLAREGEDIGETEAVDLATLAADCWRNVDTGDATLRTDTDRTVEADRSRLQQLVENLVRNAVEHGGDGVTVAVGDLADGFYVADDGPGIPEEEREAVFDTGYSGAGEGTGFGLAIVEQVADAHGWTVRIVEGVAGGTRFEITGVDVAG